MIEFEEDNIVLDLPAGESEPEVVDGWKILPLTYPQVKVYLHQLTINLPEISFYMSFIIQIKKVDIEQYQCGKNVPGCTIELEWRGSGEPQQLSYRVNLIGAKKPANLKSNYFYMRYHPQTRGKISGL